MSEPSGIGHGDSSRFKNARGIFLGNCMEGAMFRLGLCLPITASARFDKNGIMVTDQIKITEEMNISAAKCFPGILPCINKHVVDEEFKKTKQQTDVLAA